MFVQIVPIAMQQQAVEAGRTRDKGRVADVGNGLPASSQVQRCCSLCDFSCCALEVDCLLQAVLRAFSMLLAWAPTQQEDVAATLKHRFSSWAHVLNDVLSYDACSDARVPGSEAHGRARFVHKLLLNYARDQAHKYRPGLNMSR